MAVCHSLLTSVTFSTVVLQWKHVLAVNSRWRKPFPVHSKTSCSWLPQLPHIRHFTPLFESCCYLTLRLLINMETTFSVVCVWVGGGRESQLFNTIRRGEVSQCTTLKSVLALTTDELFLILYSEFLIPVFCGNVALFFKQQDIWKTCTVTLAVTS